MAKKALKEAGAPESVIVNRHFNAPPERVFDAWLDAESAKHWLFTTPGGERLRAEIEPSVGGHFLFTERRKDGAAEHWGEYHEIDRPNRLVFTFANEPYAQETTRVSVNLSPQDEGCELTLTHEGVPGAMTARVEKGWTKILESLARALN